MLAGRPWVTSQRRRDGLFGSGEGACLRVSNPCPLRWAVVIASSGPLRHANPVMTTQQGRS
ncbi:hypothetical protein BOTBODRAFT_28211 [Botryobasidium botryosum FD-172 SS1]|uniref:Uncharacterized protein n=1 Tax=Botryobasidium botryosum (strain FD-172 SS1) TaxID=930990 RepID=A0A067N677_BOTB1|nr:hypothetical protein BOTBODRAFT_28211 [Botryobasidium botryosum FD-172 SS1]